MKRIILVVLVGALHIYGSSNATYTITLSWAPSPDANVIGYQIHTGVLSRNYTNAQDVGIETNATINGLKPGIHYYFAVTAYESTGLQSDYSDESEFLVSDQDTTMIPMPVKHLHLIQK